VIIMEPTDEKPSMLGRTLKAFVFVGSAGAAAAILRGTWRYPALGIVVLAMISAYFTWRWWSHRRLVVTLKRGDVSSAISQWSGSLGSIPHPETMAPLMTATALAAFGRVEEARTTLAAAARGPAWEAAIEHRLFVDVLLSTFEGDVETAKSQAARLAVLPMPDAPEMKRRVSVLREATEALTRAFSHESRPGDLARLEAASASSPLVHWAMRYGAAIVAIDGGDSKKAMSLLEGAPEWPVESTFRAFHREITSLVTPPS
jgi:hypothetical protein